MDLIALSMWLPKWLDPETSSAPAKVVYSALVLLAVAVVYLDRWIVRKLHQKQSHPAAGTGGSSKS